MTADWIIVEDGVDDEEAPVIYHLARYEDGAYKIVATFRYGRGDADEVLSLVSLGDPDPSGEREAIRQATSEFLDSWEARQGTASGYGSVEILDDTKIGLDK